MDILNLYHLGLFYFVHDAQVAHWMHKEISYAIFAQVRIFFCQWAIYVQDCTSFPNVQYMHKIADIIGRNMSHITLSALNLESWYSLHSYFWVATSFDCFLHKHL